MKIGILSKGPRLYSTRRLKEVAKRRGHSCRVYNPLDFALHVAEHSPMLFFRGKQFRCPDAVIPRVGSAETPFALAVLRQLEQMGVFTHNDSKAVAIARDKFRTLQILSRRDIGIPPTSIVHRQIDVYPAIMRLGGAPIIIKLLQGTQGVGVMLAETDKSAEAIVETLQVAQKEVLIQRFVSESQGSDVRAFVVGNRVVASMRRSAEPGEFRSNVHRGAHTERITLDSQSQNIAVRAAHILGLRVAGVDILESNEGPKVMEVNASPGLEGIEEATGVDVASAIIEHLEEQVLVPEVDLREKLSLSTGYGVAEFHIAKRSDLAKRTVSEAQLTEKDVRVLMITRQGLTIPNPPDDFVLLSGDGLLCFGKLVSLKALLPSKPQRKRKRSTANTC